MTKIQLDVLDGGVAEDNVEPVKQLERFKYKVIAKEGIFKNGKLYKKGSTIMLDKQTAQRFIDAGDVEGGETE